MIPLPGWERPAESVVSCRNCLWLYYFGKNTKIFLRASLIYFSAVEVCVYSPG